MSDIWKRLFCRRGWHSWRTDPLAYGPEFNYYANRCDWCRTERYTEAPLQGYGFRHAMDKP